MFDIDLDIDIDIKSNRLAVEVGGSPVRCLR